MQRITLAPRSDWKTRVEAAGLTFHSPVAMAPQPYWDESAAYRFSAAEIDTLESAANELQQMCLAAAQHVIDQRRYAELAIPTEAIPAIESAWNSEPPALYGRFDIVWGGAGAGSAPKLLEYNADTPTSLIEASVIQWNWMEEMAATLPGGQPDQFNSIHDRLIAKWKDLQPYVVEPVYFAALAFDSPSPQLAKEAAEDMLTVTYLRDTAQQAGLETRQLALQDIGWNEDRQCFVDLDETEMRTLFKLYPWESMLGEQFGPMALASYAQASPMVWIEPVWKMLLSNKGILPILWQLYPDHPLLLPAYFEDHGDRGALTSYARKPLLSREGANITLVQPGAAPIATGGQYGAGRFIRQALAPESVFATRAGERRYPVLGLWMIDQECGGMGIRESAGPITDNLSSFVPHYFD
jgi:glutathionylspermidine synthase